MNDSPLHDRELVLIARAVVQLVVWPVSERSHNVWP